MNKIYLDPEIYYIENFIEEDYLKEILKDCVDQSNWTQHGDFYLKHYDNLRKKNKIVLDYCKEKVEDTIDDEFNKLNYNYNLQKYVRSSGDWALPPHTDTWDSKNDDNPTKINSKHVTKGYIIYFNDDYEGGEVVYVNKNITIKPKSGMLLVHSGLEECRHGVKSVSSGERYFLSGFVYNAEVFKNL